MWSANVHADDDSFFCSVCVRCSRILILLNTIPYYSIYVCRVRVRPVYLVCTEWRLTRWMCIEHMREMHLPNYSSLVDAVKRNHLCAQVNPKHSTRSPSETCGKEWMQTKCVIITFVGINQNRWLNSLCARCNSAARLDDRQLVYFAHCRVHQSSKTNRNENDGACEALHRMANRTTHTHITIITIIIILWLYLMCHIRIGSRVLMRTAHIAVWCRKRGFSHAAGNATMANAKILSCVARELLYCLFPCVGSRHRRRWRPQNNSRAPIGPMGSHAIISNTRCIFNHVNFFVVVLNVVTRARSCFILWTLFTLRCLHASVCCGSKSTIKIFHNNYFVFFALGAIWGEGDPLEQEFHTIVNEF